MECSNILYIKVAPTFKRCISYTSTNIPQQYWSCDEHVCVVFTRWIHTSFWREHNYTSGGSRHKPVIKQYSRHSTLKHSTLKRQWLLSHFVSQQRHDEQMAALVCVCTIQLIITGQTSVKGNISKRVASAGDIMASLGPINAMNSTSPLGPKLLLDARRVTTSQSSPHQ